MWNIEEIKSRLTEYQKYIVIGVFLLGGGYFLGHQKPKEVEYLEEPYEEVVLAQTEEVREEEVIAEVQTPEILVVDVKGAVAQPGIYTLTSEKRVQDAIDEAGGALAFAELRRVNLAQLLSDQMVVYVPALGEDVIELPRDMKSTSDPKDEESGKVNLNTADSNELQTLNGVGEKRAQMIIDYREEHGSFQVIEDVMNVSGIGEKSFANLKDFITVGHE